MPWELFDALDARRFSLSCCSNCKASNRSFSFSSCLRTFRIRSNASSIISARFSSCVSARLRAHPSRLRLHSTHQYDLDCRICPIFPERLGRIRICATANAKPICCHVSISSKRTDSNANHIIFRLVPLQSLLPFTFAHGVSVCAFHEFCFFDTFTFAFLFQLFRFVRSALLGEVALRFFTFLFPSKETGSIHLAACVYF